jgi:hypothetical protein
VWLRAILGALYTAMALGQVASWTRMPAILDAYRLTHGAGSLVLAVALVVGELVCGLWLVARARSPALAPVWVYTAVSGVWATLGVQAVLRGLTVTNCGCFGVYLRQRLSWLVLAQDMLLLVYAVVLIRAALRSRCAAEPSPTGLAPDPGAERS